MAQHTNKQGGSCMRDWLFWALILAAMIIVSVVVEISPLLRDSAWRYLLFGLAGWVAGSLYADIRRKQ